MELLIHSPRPDVARISLPVVMPAEGVPLDLAVLSGAEIVARGTIRESGRASVSIEDRLLPVFVVRISSAATDPEHAPRILWSQPDPYWPVQVRQGGRLIRRMPILRVEHGWPSRGWLLLWLAAAGAGAAAWRGRRALPAAVVLLGIACTISSTLLWQADYTLEHFGHWDPDNCGEYAQRLAGALTETGRRAEVGEWIRHYPHAHNVLAPAIMVIPIAIGVRQDVVYAAFSSVCGGLALVLACRFLWLRLGLSHRAALAGLLLFGGHLLHLRSFSRPITDELGLLLVLWTLDLLVDRLVRVTPGQTASLALLAALHVLARPQGLAYSAFLLAATLACDAHRTGSFGWKTGLKTVAIVGLVPAAGLTALYFRFDWFSSLALSLAKAATFREWNRAEFLATSLVGFVQCLPLLWLRARPGCRKPEQRLLATWGVFCVVLLVVVRAPFWMRHLLPALPALVAWTGLRLDGFEGHARAWRLAGVLLLVAANVGFVTYLIFRSGATVFSRYLVFG